MKKRQVDKIRWRKRVKNALNNATLFVEGMVPNDAKKALKSSLFAFNTQKKYLPTYHPDFLKTFRFFNTLYDYERLDRPTKALEIAFREITIQRKNSKRLIQLYSEIAGIYQHILNDAPKANIYRQKEIQIRLSQLDEILSSSSVAHEYEKISWLYRNIGNRQKQEEFLLKQVEVLEKFLCEKPRYFCETIARIFRQLEMYDKSLKFHFRELDYALENKDKFLATIYDSIAFNYKKLNNYDKSLEFHFKSIENMIEINGDKRGKYHFLRIFHYRTAETYFEINEFELAKSHLLRSIDFDSKNSILVREEANLFLDKINLQLNLQSSVGKGDI